MNDASRRTERRVDEGAETIGGLATPRGTGLVQGELRPFAAARGAVARDRPVVAAPQAADAGLPARARPGSIGASGRARQVARRDECAQRRRGTYSSTDFLQPAGQGRPLPPPPAATR